MQLSRLVRDNILGHIDSDIEYKNALWFFNAGRYEQAISHLNRALMGDVHRAEFWALRAECYGMLSEYPLALNDYRRAIELEPKNGDHYLGRGRICYRTGHCGAAIADWKIAAELGNREAITFLWELYGIRWPE